VRALLCIVVSISVAGCAARGPRNVSPDKPRPIDASPRTAQRAPEDSLEAFMAKVRKLSSEARPDRQGSAGLAARYPGLAAADAVATFAPSPVTLRAAAEEYRRAGIFDKAFDLLTKALAIDWRDATTHDAIARLWRDSGLPQLGLGDAHRAIFFDPDSPVVHNTLGTLFQALGRRTLARAEYERALQLDDRAAYALNNLCYGWVLDGEVAKAIAACERALRINPQLTAARNNLGLAHAVGGDVASASAAFAQAGDRAAERYNIGIIRLAQRDFHAAAAAFDSAHAARPSLAEAAARAIQARAAMKAGNEPYAY
jgi:tetratricopeptide (TPR) repeat protein